jgi:hypothetical protein
MGKPLLSLANPELIHYLQKNKPKNASILVIGWTQAQAIYYLLRDDYRPTYRSSQFFDYRDTFEKNESIDLLKSMGIREHIAEIVEGGKEAFKKREEKYGF